VKAHAQKVPRSGEASFVYRVKADRRFSRGWHFHPEYELTFIVESRGRRLVGDSIERYSSGDLVLLGPNLPHTWRSEDPPGSGARRERLHRAVVIQFDQALLGERLLAFPEMEGIAGLLPRASRGLAIAGRTRDEAGRRMLAMRRMAPFERLLELLRILQGIAGGGKDLRALSRMPVALPAAGSGPRRIDRVFSHLHDRYTEPVSQAEVARQAGMTSAGFSRFFRRSTGTTFGDYLAGLRLSHAASLLMETSMTILEVSLRSGFNNLSNFNRRFRRWKGMTPREFRARHAEAAGS
jgi:AraC-like DNA-binding protein